MSSQHDLEEPTPTSDAALPDERDTPPFADYGHGVYERSDDDVPVQHGLGHPQRPDVP